MKKLFAVLLALAMLLGCVGLASAEDRVGADEALIAAAQAEGTLTVYGRERGSGGKDFCR